MARPLQVLIAEDNPLDVEMILHELHRAGFDPQWTQVETESDFIAKLHGGLDLVISDYSMPQFDGMRALDLVNDREPAVPFILVSGTIGEEIAVTAMRRGATDYLLKDRLTRLGTAVEQALAQSRFRRERRRMEEKLLASEQRFRALIEASAQIVWTADAAGSVLEDSPSWRAFTGQALHEWRGLGWLEVVHPDDRRIANDSWNEAVARQTPMKVEYRLKHVSGEWRWTDVRAVALRDAQDRVTAWVGMNVDTHEQKLAAQLLEGQRAVLEMIGSGRPLAETLTALVNLVEAQSTELLCSILLLDPSGTHLQLGAAPSLPDAYNRAIDGVNIGPTAGSCGTAAHLGQEVLATDIATDPLWAGYRDVALSHGLRACWSTPILDAQNRVLGTYAIYYREPTSPAPAHLQLVNMATHTAGIAIGRHRSEHRIKEQLDELLRWQEVMLGREDRVQALKAEINTLLVRQKEPPRYPDIAP